MTYLNPKLTFAVAAFGFAAAVFAAGPANAENAAAYPAPVTQTLKLAPFDTQIAPKLDEFADRQEARISEALAAKMADDISLQTEYAQTRLARRSGMTRLAFNTAN